MQLVTRYQPAFMLCATFRKKILACLASPEVSFLLSLLFKQLQPSITMNVCKSCDNWNPEGTVFCPRCGMHSFEGELISRYLNWRLLIACSILLLVLIYAAVW